MNNDIPVLDGGESTIPDLDTTEFAAPDNMFGDFPNPDAGIDSMFEDYLAQTGQDELLGADIEQPEVSEESVEESADETSPSDDESPNVEQDEDEVTEEATAQDEVEYNDVSYDELKADNFRLPIKNSKTGAIEYKTIDQINAEVNRARSQDESRDEVETLRKELEAKTSAFERDEFTFQQQQVSALGAQQLKHMQAQAAELQQQYATAAEAGEATEAMKIQAKLNALGQEANRVNAQMQEANANIEKARNEAAANAAAELSKYGLGDLATDPQRVEAFQEYAFANLPQSIIGVVNTNPGLLAMVEKARLYDKAHTDKPKAKLKGSKKTLKAGVSKPVSTKPKSTDRVQDTIDSMFS